MKKSIFKGGDKPAKLGVSLAVCAVLVSPLTPAMAFDVNQLKAAAEVFAEQIKNHPLYHDAQKSADNLSGMVTDGAGYVSEKIGLIGDASLDVTTPAGTVDGLQLYDLGAYKAFIKCSDRTASIVVREEKVDTGNEPRYDNFFINKKIPRECQPKSTGTYKWSGKPSYDRGHLAGADAFDYSKQALYASNFMLNVVPQISATNRSGSWLEIEMRMECMRTPRFIGEGKSLTTIAGVVWGNDESDDHFIRSHGQRTPSKLFKIVVQKSPDGVKSYAWVVPNDHVEPSNVSVDSYLVSPEYIEQITGYQELRILVPESTYKTVATKTPNLTNGCDFS